MHRKITSFQMGHEVTKVFHLVKIHPSFNVTAFSFQRISFRQRCHKIKKCKDLKDKSLSCILSNILAWNGKKKFWWQALFTKTCNIFSPTTLSAVHEIQFRLYQKYLIIYRPMTQLGGFCTFSCLCLIIVGTMSAAWEV